MRILFLSQRVPYPPHKGDKLRAFHTIQYLSKNHDVTLFCLSDQPDDDQHRIVLKKYCDNVHIFFQSRWKKWLRCLIAPFFLKSFSESYFYSRDLKRKVDEILRKNSVDLIYIYCSSMAPYVLHRRDYPKMIDFVDADSDKWAQYACWGKYSRWWFRKHPIYLYEYFRVRALETRIGQIFQCGIVVSNHEKAILDKHCDSLPIYSVSNGVDLEYFFLHAGERKKEVVFTGNLDYKPNINAVSYFWHKIWPKILKHVPDVKLKIVGRDPVYRILKFNGLNNTEIHSNVPDIRPYLRSASVAIAPMLQGRGIQNKVLEAMAMGTPVVCTTLAAEGINVIRGEEVLVADNASDFTNEVLRILQNPDLVCDLSKKARQRVEKDYSWVQNLDKMEQIISRIGKG